MSKVEQLITEHIDIWTSAILAKSTAGRGSNKKYELYGIKKLRELILELAVRGKLVPQDPSDEPASVLLERIAAEKSKLIKEGKVRKTKTLPEISSNEKPFDIPKSWRWVRVADIGSVFNGNSISANIKEIKYSNNLDGMPYIATKDIEYGFESLNYINGVSIPFNEKSFKVAHKGAVLICAEGGSAGRKCGIAEQDICFGNKLFANELFSGVLPRFILTAYLSSAFYNQFSELMTGIIGGISSANFITILIPIPPTNEQLRIVSKVDELMLLCDQLEQQTEISIDAHASLVEVLLATLTDSADANELAQNWARVSEHFATLFTTEQSIEALKQTLLQLAVMGKLVPQDPADEPAAVLLEKIAAEKAQLIKDKKIKPQKLLPPIAEEEQLFDLPPGWGWCRLDDICNGITSGSTPPKSFFSEDKGVPYLKVYNIKNQQIDFEYKSQFVEENYHASTLKRSLLVPGDVVMNIVGPPLGKIAIIPSTYPEWNCNQAIVMFRPIVSELNKYIYTYLISGMFLDKIELIGTAGQDNISVTKSRSILLPTPPVLEQHRIVAKVDELMKICDQLKANLQQSQETQVQLTDALIDQALE